MLDWIRKHFRYYFGFSKTEANGSMVLMLIILLATLVPYTVKNYYISQQVDSKYTVTLDSLRDHINEQLVFDSLEEVPDSFDPNGASYKQLMAVGLSNELSNRWLKYVDAGGSFESIDDVRKIYGLSDSEFDRIRPFLLRPKKKKYGSKKVVTLAEAKDDDEYVEQREDVLDSQKDSRRSNLHFNLNEVDTVNLQEVNGIGKVLSSRIIRFRSALGGFVKLNQLNEVYGVEDYALKNMKEAVFVEEGFKPTQLNINNADIDVLASHPYISYQQAKVILAYRGQHGDFLIVKDLLEIYTLDSVWFARVSPYLTN